MSRRGRYLGDIDGWLTLTADAFITMVVIQSSLGELFGARLPWWRLTLPLLLGNLVAAGLARRRGYTALPFGPNTIFILAFIGGVLRPLNEVWVAQGLSAAERATAALGLTGASLWVYAVLLVGGTHALLALRPDLSRRALLIPLAAICWVYLVTVPVIRLAGESYVMWIPAGLLAVLSLRPTPPLLPWALTMLAWVGLGAIGGYETSWTIPSAELDLEGVEVLAWAGRSELWGDAIGVLLVLALANIFGTLENVVASVDVGDDYETSEAIHLAGAGTILSALINGMAPLTLYIGHPAYKRRGAGWLYVILAAVTLFAGPLVVTSWWLEKIPVPVFYGAVLFVGIAVGSLPKHHLRTRAEWAIAFVVGLPVLAGWAAHQPGLPFAEVVEALGHGGGLISVGWALWWLGELRRVERLGLLSIMAIGSGAGLIHGEAGSLASVLFALLYVVAALRAFATSDRSRD